AIKASRAGTPAAGQLTLRKSGHLNLAKSGHYNLASTKLMFDHFFYVKIVGLGHFKMALTRTNKLLSLARVSREGTTAAQTTRTFARRCMVLVPVIEIGLIAPPGQTTANRAARLFSLASRSRSTPHDSFN
ncbi:hypothetical protein, partial [Paraburkholderia rhynchosiae]